MTRPTILLADDHTIVLEGLAGLLRTEFSLVGAVPDGDRLLAEAQRLRPDVIVTDMTMPGLSGIEVLRRIKADEYLRSTPVVMLTSSREDQDVAATYELGVNSYIVKPVEFEDFVEAVSKLGLYWLVLNQPPG